ncbi:MAG: helix-turn-helix domain containing protein [Armatimonadetes bacterium]|nr:helix-turn-helix domain containing protein [Armatimonadota bacterium]
MPKHLKLRTVTPDEERALRRLAASHTQGHALVQRAQLLVALLDDPTLTATAAGHPVGFRSACRGPAWVKRFNTEGLEGLPNRPRQGRPETHSPQTRSALIALALQKPASLNLPFALWTLERLQTRFQEQTGVHLSDSTIWTWLAAEGLEWKRQQSGFRDPDQQGPEFAEKRGPS